VLQGRGAVVADRVEEALVCEYDRDFSFVGVTNYRSHSHL
jgi:hypothetical protein